MTSPPGAPSPDLVIGGLDDLLVWPRHQGRHILLYDLAGEEEGLLDKIKLTLVFFMSIPLKWILLVVLTIAYFEQYLGLGSGPTRATAMGIGESSSVHYYTFN